MHAFVKFSQRLLYPLQCDQLASGCCIQIQVAVAWDKLLQVKLCTNPEILQLCIEPGMAMYCALRSSS